MMAERDMFPWYSEAVVKEIQIQHEIGIMNEATVF
jgi:hypothetical protein